MAVRRVGTVLLAAAALAAAGCGSNGSSSTTVTTVVVVTETAASRSAPGSSTQSVATPTQSVATPTPAGSITAPATTPPTTTPRQDCGVDLDAPAVADAIARQPNEPLTGRSWYRSPVAGNYDPCATLSTVLIIIEGATGSSPEQALMFHDGRYLGTGTSKAYGFTSLNEARTTDDTVVLDYKTPGTCNACDDGTVTSVRYQWSGSSVVMLDSPPAN